MQEKPRQKGTKVGLVEAGRQIPIKRKQTKHKIKAVSIIATKLGKRLFRRP